MNDYRSWRQRLEASCRSDESFFACFSAAICERRSNIWGVTTVFLAWKRVWTETAISIATLPTRGSRRGTAPGPGRTCRLEFDSIKSQQHLHQNHCPRQQVLQLKHPWVYSVGACTWRQLETKILVEIPTVNGNSWRQWRVVTSLLQSKQQWPPFFLVIAKIIII